MLKRKAPLRAGATLEARLWLRLKLIEGTRFRRRASFKTFTLDFVEHNARLVILLEDGEPGRSRTGQVVRDRLLGEAGYVILRLWRAEAVRDLSARHGAHQSCVGRPFGARFIAQPGCKSQRTRTSWAVFQQVFPTCPVSRPRASRVRHDFVRGPGRPDYPGHPTTTPEITAADISARDKAMADDAFEGRGPGTVPGEAAAAMDRRRTEAHRHQARQPWQLFPERAGGHHHAGCAVVQLRPSPRPRATMTPKFADDVGVLDAAIRLARRRRRKSDVVFVGYGVVAPEYNWNDYAGIDVKGKTVVILINDPGNEDAHPDPKFFKGRAMTYYGRWTYKYEEAARQGAAAVIIVHETKPAAYGWQVVRNSNGAANMWLDANGNTGQIHAPIRGLDARWTPPRICSPAPGWIMPR